MKKILFLCFFISIIFIKVRASDKIFKIDNLAADDISKKYKTGIIDPMISMIPYRIQKNIFIDPVKYIPELVKFLISDTKDTYLIVKIFHDWITDIIAYDKDLFCGISKDVSRQVYTLLPLKRTTCSGYSRFFKKMCDIAGIEAVYISGYAKSYYNRSKNKPGNHTWNAVKINNKWYLVDFTVDDRMDYKNRKLSEEGNYRDTNLFIHPEAKILINFPNEEKDKYICQFSAPGPGEYEAVIYAKHADEKGHYQSIYKFILNSTITGSILPENSKTFYENGLFSYNKLRIIDTDFTGDKGYYMIDIEYPENIFIFSNLKDFNNENVTDAIKTSYYTNRKRYYYQIPSDGTYFINIHIKDLMKNQKSHIFSGIVKLENVEKTEGIVPQPGELFFYRRFIQNDFKLLSDGVEIFKNTDIYFVKIRCPENFELINSLRDEENNKFKGHYEYHTDGNDYTFYFSSAGKNIYLAKIYAKEKKIKKNSYNTICFFTINDYFEGSFLPVPGKLHLYKSFYENNFELIYKKLEKFHYKIIIKCPDGYKMNCNLKDENQNKMKDFYTYEQNMDKYTFDFYFPGKGRYIGRIYMIDKNNKWNNIAVLSF